MAKKVEESCWNRLSRERVGVAGDSGAGGNAEGGQALAPLALPALARHRLADRLPPDLQHVLGPHAEDVEDQDALRVDATESF